MPLFWAATLMRSTCSSDARKSINSSVEEPGVLENPAHSHALPMSSPRAAKGGATDRAPLPARARRRRRRRHCPRRPPRPSGARRHRYAMQRQDRGAHVSPTLRASSSAKASSAAASGRGFSTSVNRASGKLRAGGEPWQARRWARARSHPKSSSLLATFSANACSDDMIGRSACCGLLPRTYW